MTDPSFKRRLLLQAGAAALLAPVTESRAVPAGLITRAIPRSGERLPAIGLGTYQVFDLPSSQLAGTELQAVLKRFVELGGAVVDSSPMYGHAEATTGILSSALNVRKSLFLATKVWTQGRAAGIAQMQDSMRLMRDAVIDLMQVHNLVDWRTHLDTLAGWKAEGRVRYVGVTHYTPSAHAELEAVLPDLRATVTQTRAETDNLKAELAGLIKDRDAAAAPGRRSCAMPGTAAGGDR